MRSLIVAAVLSLAVFPAMAADAISRAEVGIEALKTVVEGYLYPSKIPPGDVFNAIQELEREVQEAKMKPPVAPGGSK